MLDQRQLPGSVVFMQLKTWDEVATAISTMLSSGCAPPSAFQATMMGSSELTLMAANSWLRAHFTASASPLHKAAEAGG